MKTTIRGHVLGVLAGIAALGLATSAAAQIQQTPDSQRYLIQRTVGAEQWAISYNFEDRTVTGNVFKTDGSPPSFIWCEITNIAYSATPADNQYTLDCFGSDACTSAPCDPNAWTMIQSGIQLSGNFFLPPGTQATYGGQVEPVFTSSCALAGCHDAGAAQAGLNLTAGAAYNNIVDVPSTQQPMQSRVMPFDSSMSYLFGRIDGGGMPPGGPLPMGTIDAFRAWIQEGAARN